MSFNYYAFYLLQLQPAITFIYVIQFEHMTRHFDRLGIKLHLMAFNCRSDVQNTFGLKL